MKFGSACQFTDLLTDTQGFIARDDTRKEIVVAFRGTQQITNIFTGVFLANFVQSFGCHKFNIIIKTLGSCWYRLNLQASMMWGMHMSTWVF